MLYVDAPTGWSLRVTNLTFSFLEHGGPEPRSLVVRDLVIAGWTGRDPRKVLEHVEELALLGVPRPAAIPCFYRAGVEMLTTAAAIDCLGGESSGEAEYILVIDADGEWWIGLGSDHTDREVESTSIPVSKQMCPKPVAPLVWRFSEVADHWDALHIRSWVEEQGTDVPYQDGGIAAMLDPRDTVAVYRERGHELRPGTVMFGGTLPVIGGIRPCQTFAMELRDAVMDRAITHRYTARWLPPVG